MRNVLRTVFLAAVVCSSGVASADQFSNFTNGSFESQNLNQSWVGYLYGDATFNQMVGYGPVAVAASGWSFSPASGLSYTVTTGPQLWGGAASDGDVFGFLRLSGGYISQTFNAVAGSYTFSYDLEQRTNYRVGGPQTVAVLFDGNAIWSGTPGDAWSSYSFTVHNQAAGPHTISFVGTNLNNASDTTAFIDNVALGVTPAVPEPESVAMMLAGMGLLGAIARRRKAQL